MFCSNCGAEIKDGCRFCPKCGAALDNNLRDETTKEPVKTQPKKAKKIVKILLPILAVLVIAAAGLYIFLGKGTTFASDSIASKEGHFRGIPWGSDMETVEKIVGKTCYERMEMDDDTISTVEVDFAGIKDCVAQIDCCFDNGQLDEVKLWIVKVGDDGIDLSYDFSELFDRYVKTFNKLYGEYTALSDELYYWKTVDTEIYLGNGECMLDLDFEYREY